MEVTSCVKAKEVNGKNIYKVGLSDGRFGESFATEIPIGTKVEDLNLEDTQYGLKIKLIKKNGFGGRPATPKGNESFALSYAKDYACAMIGQGKEFKTDHIIQLADKFYTWLEGKKK